LWFIIAWLIWAGQRLTFEIQQDLHDRNQFTHVQRLQAEVVILICAFVVR